ncbi:hypothetical protein ACTQW9_10695 [Lachnospiraceae bacterium LCP19S3_B12]
MDQEYRFIKEEILGYSRLKPCSLAVAEEAFSRLPALHCHGLAFVPYLRLAEGTGIVIRDPRSVWEAGITEQLFYQHFPVGGLDDRQGPDLAGYSLREDL